MAIKLTEKQKTLIQTLLKGEEVSLRDAIAGSGFPALAIATFMGWPFTQLNTMVREGKLVSDLPAEWREALRKKAESYGLT